MMTDEEKKRKHAEACKRWREQHKGYQNEYGKRNREKITAINKKWRNKNKEHVNDWAKQFYHNNKDRINEANCLRHQKNKETNLARNKRWKEEHSDSYKEQFKLYLKYYRITHRKKGYIMDTHWTEKLNEIDKKIAKLNQLKQSIIEATSEPEEEQTEPTIDRYGFKKNERRIYYDLPEYQEIRDYRNMNHVPLEGASNYELYENGELFSRKEGRFVDGIIANNSGDVIWKVVGDDGVMIDIWRKMEMKRCFPEFKEKIKSRHGLQYS